MSVPVFYSVMVTSGFAEFGRLLLSVFYAKPNFINS